MEVLPLNTYMSLPARLIIRGSIQVGRTFKYMENVLPLKVGKQH